MKIPHLGRRTSIPNFRFLLSRLKEFKDIQEVHTKLMAMSAAKNHNLSSDAELKEKVRLFVEFVTASMKDLAGRNVARLQAFNSFWADKIKD